MSTTSFCIVLELSLSDSQHKMLRNSLRKVALPNPQHARRLASTYTKTRDDYDRVLANFKRDKACAVLRVPRKELSEPAMSAAVAGGFKIVEFTLTTPGCLESMADFRKKHDGDVMVGCGTVLDVADAKAALDAGAEFIVAPIFQPEVVTWCALNNVVCAPGCQTPTEAFNAYKAGAPIQKIFPGVAGGATWIKAVSSALPMLTLNPTSGVDLDNAGEILKNGANSVGLVAPLFPPAAIAAEDWGAVEANARKVIGNIKAAGFMSG